MVLPKDIIEKINANNHENTLVMTSASAGNVGQLAVDLIISTLGLKYLCESDLVDCVLPVVGPDPYALPSDSNQRMMTAIEAFGSDDMKLIVIQQRSGFIRHKQAEYLERLMSWIEKMDLKRIVLLTSCFAAAQIDSEMQICSQVRHLCTESARSLLDNVPNGLLCPSVEPRPDPFAPDILTGAGMAKHFYERCKMSGVPLLMFVSYCNEGQNNVQDSFELVDACNRVMQLNPSDQKWRPPTSWNNLLQQM